MNDGELERRVVGFKSPKTEAQEFSMTTPLTTLITQKSSETQMYLTNKGMGNHCLRVVHHTFVVYTYDGVCDTKNLCDVT